ncbi:hypothetical protein SRABI06_05740 [Pseudomonas brassicacearum]|nr:hypothetical protein SRABI06_05740 [Pseudomonas brassicacearum]
MDLLYLPPVDPALRIKLLEPRQFWIGLDHRIDGRAYRLLVHLSHVSVDLAYRVDHQVALSSQFALAKGLVSATFTLHAEPSCAGLALLVTLLMQILHAFKNDVATAADGQVIAAVELSRLISLIASALQSQVAARGDRAADMTHVGHFVTLGLLFPPTALTLFLVKRVIAVGLGYQFELVAGIEISLVTGADATGDQTNILTRGHGNITAGLQLGADLTDMILLAGHLLALGVGVFLIGSRSQGHVADRVNGNVSLGLQVAADGGEVAAGAHVQVPTSGDLRAGLFDGLAAVARPVLITVGLFGRTYQQVTPGADLQIAARQHHATDVEQVAPDAGDQIVGGFDTGGAVQLAFNDVAALLQGLGAFIYNIPQQTVQADITAVDDASRTVEQGVAC